MKYCENVNCEYEDEGIERITDYQIAEDNNGASVVTCIYCLKGQREALRLAVWSVAQRTNN